MSANTAELGTIGVEFTGIQRFEAVKALGQSALHLRQEAGLLETQAAVLGAETYEVAEGREIVVRDFDAQFSGSESTVGIDVWIPGRAPDKEGHWNDYDGFLDEGEQESDTFLRIGRPDVKPNPRGGSIGPRSVYIGSKIEFDPETKRIYVYGASGTTRVKVTSKITLEERDVE